MGFPLLRNPFCVVHPMEDGATIFSARLLDVRQYGNNERTLAHPLIYPLTLTSLHATTPTNTDYHTLSLRQQRTHYGGDVD